MVPLSWFNWRQLMLTIACTSPWRTGETDFCVVGCGNLGTAASWTVGDGVRLLVFCVATFLELCWRELFHCFTLFFSSWWQSLSQLVCQTLPWNGSYLGMADNIFGVVDVVPCAYLLTLFMYEIPWFLACWAVRNTVSRCHDVMFLGHVQ